MAQADQPKEQNPKKPVIFPTTGAILDDGTLVEMVYDSRERRTALVVGKDGEWETVAHYRASTGKRLVPYSPNNNIIKNNVVLLPSAPEEYGEEQSLVEETRSFIHRYVEVSPIFERIASYYVLFSWVYDAFNELPYLRLRGDYGSGKTRFLLTVGSLCYKPIFASGASTISPIFHLLDSFKGTLIIDEADFRFSDEKADMVKILNNGNVTGFPVLRIEVSPTKEFNPRAFHVFGPKIVATRGTYEDRALESRFIAESMGGRSLREGIPITLPSSYQEDAQTLRNKLLLFRLRNRATVTPREELIDRSLEPRLSQMFTPLMSIIDDPSFIKELQALAREYHREMTLDRIEEPEAHVLQAIQTLSEKSEKSRISVQQITDFVNEKYGSEYERRLSARWVGHVLRKKLALRTQKSHGTFTIAPTETPKLRRLYERYGVTTKKGEEVV